MAVLAERTRPSGRVICMGDLNVSTKYPPSGCGRSPSIAMISAVVLSIAREFRGLSEAGKVKRCTEELG
jgi:hypothetical protein